MLHKRVATETRSHSETKIWHLKNSTKRGEYWQFRMWLPKENKYARKSLRIPGEATAIEKDKAAYLEIYANLEQGETYFSITTKEGVELIFTADNENELSKRTLLYHFHKMIELADIVGREVRDLVPYSLRHFMITQRIMSRLTFRQIADMCHWATCGVNSAVRR